MAGETAGLAFAAFLVRQCSVRTADAELKTGYVAVTEV
jgi:hypothetical protein